MINNINLSLLLTALWVALNRPEDDINIDNKLENLWYNLNKDDKYIHNNIIDICNSDEEILAKIFKHLSREYNEAKNS